MSLFYTNAAAKKAIAELGTQVSALQADAATASAEIERLTAELQTSSDALAAMTTERDEAAAAYETAQTAATKATTDLEDANAKLATFHDEVESAAAARFAGLGGDPIPASAKDDNKSKSDIAGLTGFAKVSAAFASKN